MNSGIYCITCSHNGAKYIGSAKNFSKRWKRHLLDLEKGIHCNITLQRVFNKHGVEDLNFSIIEELSYRKSLILERENFHISDARRTGLCINLSDASFGDVLSEHPRREEIIDKIRKSVKRHCADIGAEGRKKYGLPGKHNPMYGKKHTELSKKKMSESQKKLWTDDYREKMSMTACEKFRKNPLLRENLSKVASERTGDKNSFFGRNHSEDTKDKIGSKNRGRPAANRVRVSVFGVEYDYLMAAAEALQISVPLLRYRIKSDKYPEYKLI